MRSEQRQKYSDITTTRLYLHTHTNHGLSDHTSHALCTKHLAISQLSEMAPQTYMRSHSQHHLLQSTHPSQSLFHFIQHQFLFSHSILHEEATLVRNILQTSTQSIMQWDGDKHHLTLSLLFAISGHYLSCHTSHLWGCIREYFPRLTAEGYTMHQHIT